MASTTHDPTMPSAGVINKAKAVLAEGGLDPEVVIASRTGDVLIKHTVLKADHFPSCHNTKLTPILEGAPNFRKVKNLRVYGVAIPTVTGLRNVMNAMGAQSGGRRVFWQNLREEPLIFINGNPFVVREADQPFSNLEYTGIDRTRVEDMEDRLKSDILTEAARFNNRILVMHENDDLSLFDHWEPVTAADVQTPQEVYAELAADGYDVDYLRIPITDEKAPKDEDFGVLVRRLWALPDDAGVMFNCQMGRGRTTTGMIIASLLYLRKMEAFPVKKGKKDTRDVVPDWFKAATAPLIARGHTSTVAEMGQLEARLKAGNYGTVRSLLRALEKGPEAKVVLDSVIDAGGAMQNLREGIFSYRSRFMKEAREKQRNVLLNVSLEYLERYYMLIAFTGYLASGEFDPGSGSHQEFPQWMAERAELRSILIRLLRRNSMAALELHQRNADGSADMGSPGGALSLAQGDDERMVHDKDEVATRSGAVLGAFSILKEDSFPGMQSAKISQTIEGAPNFRSVGGMNIYGLGMPTVDGIMGVLKTVAGRDSPGAGRRLNALWVNMREEPVVYINGQPFVLREEVRPLKNMMEYAGIDAVRLEAMEERLKKDVLAEALRHGGRILVAHESFDYGHYGELYDTWEEIDHPDAVATPADVYSGLTKQGFAVNYCRCPVTDGTAPTLEDFDTLLSNIMASGLENPIIFNCQMGIGRTTTGMVIAGLLSTYNRGQMEHIRSSPNLLETADNITFQGFLQGSLSPRSDNEDDGEDDYRDADDEKEAKVWDLAPQELEEQRSLAAGGYVGVRRVVRLLEEGDAAKRTLDSVVDKVGDLLNLRVAIMKYRKPRSSYKYLRPELQQRGAAFKKGSAYLERYALLISFTFYLEHVGPGSATFSDWINSRPDLLAAMKSIHQNPGAALAPLPLPRAPISLEGEEGDSMMRDQTKVLARRKGRLLTRRTILKSYLFEAEPNGNAGQQLPGAPDLKRALDHLPIYSVGSLTMSGLRELLTSLGAAAGGKSHVCISDIREELVVYVGGTPFTRRELEMPAAALHHAGVQANQLEEQETLIREDVQDEVAQWGGRVLLHKEVDEQFPTLSHAVSLTRPMQTSGGADTKVALGDVTSLVDSNPGAQVAAFWEAVDLNDATSVMTPAEMVRQLIEVEGFQASYQRIPLSRERTPEAHDIQQLHSQLLAAQQVCSTQDLHTKRHTATLQLVLSRTSCGSSSRFVAAALATYYIRPRRASLTGAPILHFQASQGYPSSGGVVKALDAASGEYRGIMALCRLLPGGTEAKLTVDRAIAMVKPVGDLLTDIAKCKAAAHALRPSQPMASDPEAVLEASLKHQAARQLGLHYLKRYFLLITYRCFIEQCGSRSEGYATWVEGQRELQHLLDHITLDV